MDNLLAQLRDPRYIGQEGMRAQAADQIEHYRAALAKIAKMKPEPIADGFVHGPALLFANAQRVAIAALKNPKRN